MSFDAYFSLEHPKKPPINEDDLESSSSNRDTTQRATPYKLNGAGKQQAWNHQLHSFRIMAIPFFRQESGSLCSLLLICFLAVLNSGVSVFFSYLGNFFWTALSEQDSERFYNILKWFTVALVCLAPINVFYRFLRQRLAIQWREWMTERTLDLYYCHRVYYNLELLPSIDNPDQRIAEDVRSFTEFSLAFFLTVLNSTLDLVCFSVILFFIRPQLFVAILGFASFGTLVTWLIGRKLIWLNFEKLQKEADFRFSLVRLRENCESIAFYNGEHIERQDTARRFGRVIYNMHELNVAQRNLDFFTTYYSYLVWIVPLVVVAPEYFRGAVALGFVQQSAVAFSHVLNDLSLIINQFDSLSEFAAGIDRLFQFFHAIQSVDSERSNVDASGLLNKEAPRQEDATYVVPPERNHTTTTIALSQMQPPSSNTTHSNNAAVSIRNLTLLTPDFQRTLICNLNFSMPWGQRVLITGNSGVGKSSLLRAIAGLWTAGDGTIDRPTDESVCFLPQRPYCALGSLRDQLLYPHGLGHDSTTTEDKYDRQRTSDDELLRILAAIDLMEIATRAGNGNARGGLDAMLDWSNTLSLGEQQRLAFGRILANKPALVVMDESTSALDVGNENKMYSLLRSTALGARLGYISVGHRPSLQAHHDVMLTLHGGEHYSVELINAS